MNSRYETDHDLRDLQDSEEPEREISLGVTTILGIFFALALLCAAFFGFGYSQGKHSVPATASSAESTTAAPETNASKPSPRSVASQPVVPPAQDRQSAAAPESAVVPLESDTAQPDTQKQQPQPVQPPERVRASAPTPRAEEHPASSTIATAKTPVPIPATPIASSSGTLVVQVAAMSHQEDADVVAVDLKRRGYPVTVRHTPQDKLYHVQIGPFATKKEADNVRQRLQTDGYNNAIVR